MYPSTHKRQVAQYRSKLPALQKLGQFLIYHTSRSICNGIVMRYVVPTPFKHVKSRRHYIVHNNTVINRPRGLPMSLVQRFRDGGQKGVADKCK